MNLTEKKSWEILRRPLALGRPKDKTTFSCEGCSSGKKNEWIHRGIKVVQLIRPKNNSFFFFPFGFQNYVN